jgi:PAS domain S-box-containing protein
VFDIALTIVFITMTHQRTAADLEAAQVAAERSRDRLADIIAFLPDATFAVDADKHVIAWNRAAEELVGLPAAHVLGKPYASTVAAAMAEPRPILLDLVFDSSLRVPDHYEGITCHEDKVSAEIESIELGGKRRSVWGTAGPLRDPKGELVGAIESIRDVTRITQAEKERAELQRRVLESQRLDSLGVMAGGIAHDFNDLFNGYPGESAPGESRIGPAICNTGAARRCHCCSRSRGDSYPAHLRVRGRRCIR